MAKHLRIGVTCKVYRPDILKAAKEIAAHLTGKCKLSFKKELGQKIKFKGPFINLKNPQLDILMSVGGDGTLLQTLSDLSGHKVPVLGIKRGGKGFLTEIDDDMEEKLDAVLKGNYFIEERMKLDVHMNNKYLGEAMNDAVIYTAVPGKIQKFLLEVHGDAMDTISADGMIFSTPTGSTAYALSAGGPVLDPTLDAYEITPISPFRLNSRSIVVPADTLTKARVIGRHAGLLILDGYHNHKLKKKDIVRVTRAKNKAYFVKFNKNYLKKVRRALS